MTWYLLDYGYARSGYGTQWMTNSYDVNNLVLDRNGQGPANEINVPIPVPEDSGNSFELKDPAQYRLAYNESGMVDFLEIFTNFIYARYLINPWVEGIDSTEAKNQAISERHLDMITSPVSQVSGASRSVKDELLAVYSKMATDNFDIFNNIIGQFVADGHQLIQQNPLVFKNWLASYSGESNLEQIAKVARSITSHLQNPYEVSSYYATYGPDVNFDVPEIDLNVPVEAGLNNLVTFDEIDRMWTIRENVYFTGEYIGTSPVKLNGHANEVLCCVLKPGTPVYNAVDIFPSVRIRANDDVWGAVDIGAVENGGMSELMKLYMGAKTDKLLKTAARLATLEVILKTHCLGLNPDEQRFEECGIH